MSKTSRVWIHIFPSCCECIIVCNLYSFLDVHYICCQIASLKLREPVPLLLQKRSLLLCTRCARRASSQIQAHQNGPTDIIAILYREFLPVLHRFNNEMMNDQVPHKNIHCPIGTHCNYIFPSLLVGGYNPPDSWGQDLGNEFFKSRVVHQFGNWWWHLASLL